MNLAAWYEEPHDRKGLDCGDTVTKGLPGHDIGGYLLSRLATSQELQGQGLGGQLLLAAGNGVCAWRPKLAAFSS